MIELEGRQKLNMKLKYRRNAFKAYKRASDLSKLIAQIKKKVGQIETSEDLNPFREYSELLGIVTDSGTNCTESAKSAFAFLTKCLTSIPENCPKPNIPKDDIRECRKSFEGFLRCTTDKNADLLTCYDMKKPKFSKNCNKLAELAKNVGVAKNSCFDADIVGSFTNCKEFIINKAPSIIGDCIQFDQEKDETKTFFVEGDEVVEQTKTYNSVTKELSINVPAHGNRAAIDIIIGQTQKITSFKRYCNLGDVPENFDMSLYEYPRTRKVRATTPSLALNTSTVDTTYHFDVVDRYLTEEEKDALPQSFKDICENKPIKLTSRLSVDVDSYNNLNVFNGASLSSVGRWIGRKPQILSRKSQVTT